MIATLNSRNRNTTLTYKYSVTKMVTFKKKMCPINNITVNGFQFDKLWSPFSKEFGQNFKLLSSGQIRVCVRMDGQKTGDQGHICGSEGQLVGQGEDGFGSRY